MAKSLSALKKKRKDSLSLLREKIKKDSGEKFQDDERFWKATKNTDGYCFARLRLLPAPPDGDYGVEEMPYAGWIEHFFKRNGKYYSEKSRCTISNQEDDPVKEYNNYLYNELGTEEAKQQAKEQSRKYNYVCNVYVIKDSTNPENEGKVFLWKFGKKIFKKIENAMNPPKGADRDPINVFDFWDGADFIIEGQPKTFKKDDGSSVEFLDITENSRFDEPSAFLGGDEDKLNEVWQQQYPLNEFTPKNPKFLKSYEELKAKLETVMGCSLSELLSGKEPSKRADVTDFEDDESKELENFMSDDDSDDVPDFVDDESEDLGEPKKEKSKSEKKKESEDDLDDLLDLDDLDDLDDL